MFIKLVIGRLNGALLLLELKCGLVNFNFKIVARQSPKLKQFVVTEHSDTLLVTYSAFSDSSVLDGDGDVK